jgi:CsoR family transcriptional regulator, copper-sensing transcriptional repressor
MSEENPTSREPNPVHPSHKQVVNRLARIEGHVRGVKRMVEEGASCPDVLVQIAALRSALAGVGRLVLTDHIRHCMTDVSDEGGSEAAYNSLQESLERFIR